MTRAVTEAMIGPTGSHLEGPPLIEALERRAEARPEGLCYRYLESGDMDGPVTELTWGALAARVRAVAAGITLGAELAPGDRALLLYPPGLDFVVAFLGCLRAGVIAVPAFPPEPQALRRSVERLALIAADCGARVVLTTGALSLMAGALPEVAPALRALRLLPTDALPPAERAPWQAAAPGATAFLQYTSGSTGAPKGVIVTHGNLAHNLSVICDCIGGREGTHNVGWLPLYHDMGLIGTVLGPIQGGFSSTLMSPLAFLQRPARWLQAISRYRAAVSTGPNFAYDLAVRKVSEADAAALDLSCWEICFNGAEPVRAETLERFHARFAACGLRRHVVRPVYGMAEATLIVSGEPALTPVTTLEVDAAALERGEATPVAGAAAAGTRTLVSCGATRRGQRAIIVDPESRRRLGDGRVGEIWLAGPSVAAGYFGRPEETAATFAARLSDVPEDGPFLRSGDLGFLQGEHLYVTGRRKDLIILRGRNLYPQDLERAVEGAHGALRPGCVAAFAIDGAGDDPEGVAIAAEVDAARGADRDAILAAIGAAVQGECGAAPRAIALLRPRALPKTTSGKLQRRLCRARLLAGDLELLGPIAWSEAPRGVGGAAGAEAVQGGAPRQVAAPGAAATGPADLRRALLAENGPARAELLLQAVRGALAERCGPAAASAGSIAALGLDSLGRVELTEALGARLGLALPPTLAFDSDTPEALAQALGALLDRGPAEAPAAAAAMDEQGYAATENQFLMWRHMEAVPAAYTHTLAVELSGDLAEGRLRAALQQVLDEMPAWRTRFEARGGALRARQEARCAPDLALVEGDAWSEEELAERLRLESLRPLDATRAPLLRATLIRRGPARSVLVLGASHLVYDSAVLLQTVARLLGALAGAAAAAPAPGFAAEARREAALLASPEGERLRAYWHGLLRQRPLRPRVPRDRPPAAPRGYECAAVSARLDAELGRRVAALAASLGATTSAVLLGAYQAVLHRYLGQDVVVGVAALTETLARSAAARGDGPGFNHLPLPLSFAPERRVADVVRAAHRQMGEALAHRQYPFGRLAAELGADRDELGTPVFTLPLMYAFYNMEQLSSQGSGPLLDLLAGEEAALPGLALRPLPIGSGRSATDYFLFVTQLRGALAVDLWYACDLIDRGRAQRLLDDLISMLWVMVTTPELYIGPACVTAVPELLPGGAP